MSDSNIRIPAHDAYRRWRGKIPFTNEECAQAVEAEADFRESTASPDWMLAWLRQLAESTRQGGRFSAKVYCAYMLPRLVKNCVVCGRLAIYRRGAVGMCSKHRDVSTDGFDWRRRMLEDRGAALEQRLSAADAAARFRDRLARKGRTIEGRRHG